MVSISPRRPFEFIANHIVLDFTNTVNGRPNFTRDDLACLDDVVDWACAAGLVDGTADVVRGGPPSGLDRAFALREGLYRVFGPIAAGREPQPAAVAFVARRAADAMRIGQWARGVSGYEPRWSPTSVESICHRLADEAVQLLRSPATARIGACDGCGWLFLDSSRARARRWCSMDVCGARHKMRRYHQRQITATSTT